MRRNAIVDLMAFVIVYDTVAMIRRADTITGDFRSSLEKSPVLTCLGVGYILAHLYNRPRHFQKIDAFNGYALLLGLVGKRWLQEHDLLPSVDSS